MSDTLDPPESLPEEAAAAWREIVEANDLAGRVDRAALEVLATLMGRLRTARDRVEAEGLVVADGKGKVIPHPALLVERQTAEAIRQWGDRFAPLVKPVRKRGYMADATAAAIKDAPHLQGENAGQYAGVIAAVKTIAWLIDEAQRTSMDALQRTMSGHMQTYLKTCEALQITPATAVTTTKGGRGGKLALLRGGASAHEASGQ